MSIGAQAKNLNFYIFILFLKQLRVHTTLLATDPAISLLPIPLIQMQAMSLVVNLSYRIVVVSLKFSMRFD